MSKRKCSTSETNSVDAPSKSRRRLIYNQSEVGNSSFANKLSSTMCDVTFCIPSNLGSTCSVANTHSDEKVSNDQDLLDTNDINISYTEYQCIKMFFALHSKYFENILYNNDQANISTKIKLNDIDCKTFEFIRDWCSPCKQTTLTQDNILNIFIASFKYDIPKLFDQCIDFIHNKWICNSSGLSSFIDNVSIFLNNNNNNNVYAKNININKTALLHQLKSIFDNNKIIQRYSIFIQNYIKDHCKSRARWREYKTVNIQVLKCLLDSNSFYLREDLIWNLCFDVCMYYANACMIPCNICHEFDIKSNLNTCSNSVKECRIKICNKCQTIISNCIYNEHKVFKSISNATQNIDENENNVIMNWNSQCDVCPKHCVDQKRNKEYFCVHCEKYTKRCEKCWKSLKSKAYCDGFERDHELTDKDTENTSSNHNDHKQLQSPHSWIKLKNSKFYTTEIESAANQTIEKFYNNKDNSEKDNILQYDMSDNDSCIDNDCPIIFCDLMHPCTNVVVNDETRHSIENGELKCVVCRDAEAVYYCPSCLLTSYSVCNNKQCLLTSIIRSLIFKSLIKELIPSIRFTLISSEYFISHIQPILQNFNLMTCKDILNIHMSYNNNDKKQEKVRYTFDDNIYDFINEIPSENEQVFVVDRKASCSQKSKPKKREFEAKYGDKKRYVVLKYNFQFGRSNTNLNIKFGQLMQAKHFYFNRNEKNESKNPWFYVTVTAIDGSFVKVKYDKYSTVAKYNAKLAKKETCCEEWWVVDEDDKMLRNIPRVVTIDYHNDIKRHDKDCTCARHCASHIKTPKPSRGDRSDVDDVSTSESDDEEDDDDNEDDGDGDDNTDDENDDDDSETDEDETKSNV